MKSAESISPLGVCVVLMNPRKAGWDIAGDLYVEVYKYASDENGTSMYGFCQEGSGLYSL